MEIIRINTYQDPRFSQAVLNQHGCFLVDGEPYEVEIISETEAILRGSDRDVYADLIEKFRFYTPHISVFYNQNGELIQKFHPKPLMRINLRDIQPSQFYVDADKINAIRSFIQKADDIIIQVVKYGQRYISLDGHTRLYYAVMQEWQDILIIEEKSNDYIYGFVQEAISRNIVTPYDLQLISHEEYEEKWNLFCDEYMSKLGDTSNDA